MQSCYRIKNIVNIGSQIDEIYSEIEETADSQGEDLPLLTEAVIKHHFKNYIKYKSNNGFNAGIYLMSCNIYGIDGLDEEVVDIFDAVGLDKPNIGILDDAFLAEVANIPERNLAVELLERLLDGQIKTRFARNIAKVKQFSEMLRDVVKRYQNRSIETAQVIEELIEMAKKFQEAARHGETSGLTPDELLFYDALADNESAVRELGDEILKKIAQELTESLRKNITVDWSKRESIRAKLRILVKRILRKYKYPPDQAEGAIDIVLRQAQELGEAWA